MAIEKEVDIKVDTKTAKSNVDELNKSFEAQTDLIDELEKELFEYEKALKKTSKTDLAARKQVNDAIQKTKDRLKEEKFALKELNKDRNKANNTLKESIENQRDYGGVLGFIDQKTGGAISGFQKLIGTIGSATKGFNLMKIAIIGTGVGALVIAITSLIAAFRGSEEGQNKFAKIMTVIGTLTGNLVDLLADLGEGIINAFTNPVETIKGFAKTIQEFVVDKVTGTIDSIGLLGSAIKKVFSGDFKGALEDTKKGFKGLVDNSPYGIIRDGIKDATAASKEFIKEQLNEAKAAASVADMRAKADKIERQLIIDRSKLESEIANLRLKSRQEEEFSAAERKQALLDAQKLEDQLLDKETEFLELRRDAQILENTFSRSNKENLTKEAEAIAAVNRQQAARANTARQVQREVNTITKQIEAENKRIAAEQKAIEDKKIADEQTRLNAIQKIRDDFAEKQRLIEAETELERLEIEEEKKIAELDRLNATEQQKFEVYEYYAGLRTDLEEKEIKKKADLEKLRKKQVLGDAKNTFNQVAELAGKDSKVGKAMAIASATVSGYEGVQNAYTTAQKSPITTFFPAYPVVQAALAGAVAIKNIAAIKSIDSTGKSGTTAPPTSGGRTSAPPVPSIPPAFNVVGASGTSQLAEAIGEQEQQPVQAYVVANDVTTAQSMDRNIVEGASIG